MPRMRVTRRLLVLLSGVLVASLVVATGVVVTSVRRSLPESGGEVQVPGLGSAVSVSRDERGIPQIYADDADDLFRAQGFVHAQDRFFEMDTRRHITAGRLSELVGESDDALAADKVVRTLGWRRIAEKELPLLAPTTRRYLQAYADGVNAYLADKSPGEVSLEYSVLGLSLPERRIERWTPADSLAWLKALSWDLRRNYDDEVARARLSSRLPKARIEQLYPTYPYDRHEAALSAADLVRGPGDEKAKDAADSAKADQAKASDSAEGSSDRSGGAAGGSGTAGADPVSDTSGPTPTGGTEPTGGGSTPRPSPTDNRDSALAKASRSLSAVPTLVGEGEGVGSNAWVVSGDLTRSGKPLLANDPHLAPAQPSVWYQVGLHCRTKSAACPFEVAGFSFAGVPGVFIGHNDRIAWGFTNLGADVTDMFLERVQGSTYERDGAQVPLTQRTEVIKVAGGKDVEITVRETVHGPIVSDVVEAVADAGRAAPAGGQDDATTYDVALAWTALQPGRTADALFAMNAARDWASFREAARSFEVPAQNIVYADVDGNIGYQVPGRIPQRARTSAARPDDTSGRYPARGWLSRDDWKGYVPFEDLPSVLNPESGFIVTANQAAVGPEYPAALTSDWDPGYRSQRIRELIEGARKAGRKLDVGEMSAIQSDVRHGFAPTLVPLLLRVDLSKDPFARDGQRLLADWDYSTRAGSAAAAYYNAVWRNLVRLTFDDELPEDLRSSGGGRWFEVVGSLLPRPRDAWWDDRSTPGLVESRDEIVRRAMVEARDEMTRRLGKDPSSWEWGRLHKLDLRHPVLGGETVPGPVRDLFNVEGLELGGGSSIVDATAWDASKGYGVTAVPSMRMVVDLGDLDRSTWVNLTGQSGHPWSGHYSDQVDEWVDGETFAWPFSRKAVEEAEEDRLELRPESGAPATR